MILQVSVIFFFNDTATTEIYTLSLHDALPIYQARKLCERLLAYASPLELYAEEIDTYSGRHLGNFLRSEEHTSELQSRQYLVCRLLLEKKKISQIYTPSSLYPSIILFPLLFYL